ncbi:AraC family transcriptional regulator [Rubrivivax sp. RP6-9]|uniref:AraC family transcriptional regulator n=1 Tax=Rubrivivax sp. RP6-9 TaxID=3415750 RepID=UPI003CC5BEDB
MPRPARTLLAPLDPRRYAPTAERPVRAKARHMDPDSEIQPHRHPWAQVAISVEGVARITAGDTTCLAPAWRAVWIPPDVEHVVTVVEAAELRTLYIHQTATQIGPGVPAAEQAAWRRHRVLEVSPLLREVVLQMDVGMDGSTPPAPALLARERLLGQVALDELRRAAPVRLGIALPQDKRLRALCQAVLAEPTRHDTLDGWAAASGASARTVARLFRQELGTSFGPWRQQVLLAHALTLAAQGRPMGLIAADLGYASASAFTAMVRRSVGVPPGRFFARPEPATPARAGPRG